MIYLGLSIINLAYSIIVLAKSITFTRIKHENHEKTNC